LGDEVDPPEPGASQHEALTIEGELGRLLARHVQTLLSADEAGVSMFDIEILRLLGDQRARASDLAEELGVTRTSISRHVALLTEQGLIDQRPDAEDGRAVRLEITAAGRAELAVVDARRREVVRSVTGDWSEDQRQLVATFLARLNVRGREYVEQHRRRPRPAGTP
jgi:DNA-binding MarR family transcriptional regulator